jgi:hypothetical protein
MSPEEVKLARQKLAIETWLKRTDQRLAREQFNFQQSKEATLGWKGLMTPTGGILIAATLGLIGTAVGKCTDNEIESKKQQTAIVLKASEVSPALTLEQQATQRAQNLLWFAEAKYVSLSDDQLAQLRTQAGIAKGQPVPVPAILPAVPPIDPAVRPNYKLEVPAKDPAQTNAAYRLLQLAVGEINKNVDRQSTPEQVLEYWSAVPIANVTVSMPWSGAFLAWLINKAAPNQMKLSPAIMLLWSEAEARGLVIAKDKALPGDIVVFRLGGATGPASHAGVVYSVHADGFTSIEGNVGNGVRERANRMDERVLGFFRLKD